MAYSIPYEVLYEGKQAEEYKAKKKEDKKKNDEKEWNRNFGKSGRYSRVNNYGSDSSDDHKTPLGSKNKTPSKSDIDRYSKSRATVDKDKDKAYHRYLDATEKKLDAYKNGNYKDLKKAHEEEDKAKKSYSSKLQNRAASVDALNRHMRRHPKQYTEAGIFECVEFV